MTDKSLLELLNLIGEISPFKRVRASKELVDRFNTKFNENMVDFAITVDKAATITDEELWNIMTDKDGWRKRATPLDFGDSSWRRATETGVPPQALVD